MSAKINPEKQKRKITRNEFVAVIFIPRYWFKKKIIKGTNAILMPKLKAIRSSKSISLLLKNTYVQIKPGKNKTMKNPAIMRKTSVNSMTHVLAALINLFPHNNTN